MPGPSPVRAFPPIFCAIISIHDSDQEDAGLKLYVYVIRRLVLAIPVLLGVSLITFGISWKANEGQMWRAFITAKTTPSQTHDIIVAGGFDQPWYVQFFRFLGRLLRGDLGFSRSQNLPISDVFRAFFPPTLELTIVALVFAIVVGLFLGVVSATRKDRPVDHFTRVMALAGVSLPIFWLGLILKFTFATTFAKDATLSIGKGGQAIFLVVVLGLAVSFVLFLLDLFGAFRWIARKHWMKNATKRIWTGALVGVVAIVGILILTGGSAGVVTWTYDHLPQFPLGGRFSNELAFDPAHDAALIHGPTKLLLVDALLAKDWPAFKDVAWHLVLPGFTLGYASMAIITRMMRSSMLETLSQDFVRTARAKGLSENEVLRKHARRNALLPATTVIGLAFGSLLGGAVLTETIFQWPGLGRWSTQAILNHDTNSVLAFTLMVTLFYLVANLVVDVLYALLDPRVRLE